MYFVDNGNNYDASLNIALETYLVENRLVDEPILLFYINDPSIIVGRNQNTIEEVNQAYVEKKEFEWFAVCPAAGLSTMIEETFRFASLKTMTAPSGISPASRNR